MFNVIFAHDPAFNFLKRAVSLNKTIRRGTYFLFFLKHIVIKLLS